MEVGAYILAGGKSVRMGKDKAQIKIGNKCMIEYVLGVAKQLNPNPIIISSNESHNKFGTCIPDLLDSEGPAVGISTALTHAEFEHNIIFSCDMPLVSDLIISSFDDLVMPYEIKCFGNEFLYPFPGIYSKSILPRWNVMLEKGERKLQRMIKSFDYKRLSIDNKDLFLNVNTKEDLLEAERKLLR